MVLPPGAGTTMIHPCSTPAHGTISFISTAAHMFRVGSGPKSATDVNTKVLGLQHINIGQVTHDRFPYVAKRLCDIVMDTPPVRKQAFSRRRGCSMTRDECLANVSD